MINRLTIIGVGLIGGSLALALRKAGFVGEIVGTSRREVHLQEAVSLGVIDRYEMDMAKAVEGADVVFLSVPLGAMRHVFEAIKPGISETTIISDGGSAKGCLVEDARAVFGDLPSGLVPGHPIAGTEKSGVTAAFPELYQGRRVILTPLDTSAPEAVNTVQEMWEATGAHVERMSVEHHDEVLAATSHLPHMLAFGLVDSLARMKDNDEIFRYAAGGFRDFTRIASSDPVMWRDICIHNRDALADMMQRYKDDLSEIEKAIREGNGDLLLEIFTRAKKSRDCFADLMDDSPE
jgi:prephenate dehydrogenase